MLASGDAAGLLRSSGLRATPQRIAVLKVLSMRSHPTAEEILEVLAPEHPGTSLATVYNTLSTLTEHGQVQAIGTTEGRRYDLRTDPHQHVYCRQCRRLADLPEWPGEQWIRLALPAGWEGGPWRLMVEGLCPECRRAGDHEQPS